MSGRGVSHAVISSTQKIVERNPLPLMNGPHMAAIHNGGGEITKIVWVLLVTVWETPWPLMYVGWV